MTKKQCLECKKEFEAKKPVQKFCCHACSVKYNRKHVLDFGIVAFNKRREYVSYDF